MNSIRMLAIMTALPILGPGSARVALAAPPTADPCSLLTPAQVTAELGVPAAPGQALVPSKVCVWSASAGKRVIITLQDPRSFAYARMPVGNGIVKVPVSGIGDDAVYGTTPGSSTVLTVKKGDVVFVVHVNGFPNDQLETKEKTLALDVLGKL